MDTSGMTREQLEAKIAELDAQVRKQPSDGIKRTEKGGVSVYGLQRFPVTLYPEQWIALAKRINGVLQFIEENKANLSWKEAA